MLQLAKRVLDEYRDLVLKMHVDKISNNHGIRNFELLYDLHALLGLSCILPMMNALDYLMKFNQDRKCFIRDMVAIIKICQLDL